MTGAIFASTNHKYLSIARCLVAYLVKKKGEGNEMEKYALK